MILGKADAVRIRECFERALDKSVGEEERCEALDELELLIESIDNARGIFEYVCINRI